MDNNLNRDDLNLAKMTVLKKEEEAFADIDDKDFIEDKLEFLKENKYNVNGFRGDEPLFL